MRRTGFSLVELMLVVAIIGILSAIAIPNYTLMQVKAKRAELPSNLDAIGKMQIVYDATYDGYLDLPRQPRDDSALDKEQVAWGTYDEWVSVGWSPDGPVRGNYELTATSATTYLATAHSDVDGDDWIAEYTLTELSNVTVTPSTQHYY